jgi:ATP-dependent Clp protease ATP-binding subunit ClpC
MPKINVYLPDDLAEAVRETGVPVSAVCQRALELAVRRLTMIRNAKLESITDEDLTTRFTFVTARALHSLQLAASPVTTGTVGTGHLLRGMIAEGGNLALPILRAMDIDPAALVIADDPEPGGTGDGLHFSTAAGNALELAVNEAIGMGHNYVGCEHFLIGLAAEPDGNAGKALRAAGADVKTVRRAVATAIAGYAHLRANTTAPAAATGVLTAVRAELQPLIQRIERLEQRAN